jgi:hypothetical protein
MEELGPKWIQKWEKWGDLDVKHRDNHRDDFDIARTPTDEQDSGASCILLLRS